MALLEFLENKLLEKNTLEILVIKMISPENFIVGDSSSLALLDISENPNHGKDIKIGTTIKLLKPILVDKKSLKTNKNFRPLKSKKMIDLTPSDSDLEKFLPLPHDQKAPCKLTTFKSIKASKNQTIISSITAIVGHTSRVIETARGNYQIAGLVDIDNDKMSINIYDSNLNKMEPANIYTLTKVKISTINEDGKFEKRLFTTKLTTISEASADNKAKFENVTLGQHKVTGTIIGFSELKSYNSCGIHWNKLSEDNLCVNCESKASDIKVDHTAELYLQESDSDEIQSFRLFKRQLEMLIPILDDDDDEQKLEELEGKECTVDYDEPTDIDSSIIPRRLKLQP